MRRGISGLSALVMGATVVLPVKAETAPVAPAVDQGSLDL